MSTDVVVIGGGVTGTGLARDLALRGIDVAVFERGPLAAGTSGRMHGLLHSGARYAVSDPQSARDCFGENQVLREIAPHCLTTTGGLFGALPGDDPAYVERKQAACEACGIPVEPLSGEAGRAFEPGLAPAVELALRVPDATVDPFRLTAATAAGAEAAGAAVHPGHEVTGLPRAGNRVVGVEVAAADGGAVETVRAEHVVNAAGPWADRVAGLAGATVGLRLTRGAMAVVEPRVVERVVNRCRPRSTGDIVVPCGEAAVLGTTDESVDDPDPGGPDGDAAAFLVEALSPLIPAVGDATVTRTFWGVRPLAGPAGSGRRPDSTAASRDFRVVDHAERDGVHGLTSLVGGKLTTHRLMAERGADHVCGRLGVDVACRTAGTPLPGRDRPSRLDDALERYGMTDALEMAPWGP